MRYESPIGPHRVAIPWSKNGWPMGILHSKYSTGQPESLISQLENGHFRNHLDQISPSIVIDDLKAIKPLFRLVSSTGFRTTIGSLRKHIRLSGNVTRELLD